MPDDAIQHARALFESLGLSPDDDPELAETPERFTELLREVFTDTETEPPEVSTFESDYVGDGERGEPIFLEDLPFYSMCVHHVVPFFGTIDVAYVPDETMTGFGSVGRVVDHVAARPQIQERLVRQIADRLDDALDPEGILVRCRARQMCMEMRGASKTGRLTSFASTGVLTEGERRREVMSILETGGET
jgi:GTP cyclohydrolase I